MFMGGVDWTEQLRKTYGLDRKSKCFWLRLFSSVYISHVYTCTFVCIYVCTHVHDLNSVWRQLLVVPFLYTSMIVYIHVATHMYILYTSSYIHVDLYMCIYIHVYIEECIVVVDVYIVTTLFTLSSTH